MKNNINSISKKIFVPIIIIIALSCLFVIVMVYKPSFICNADSQSSPVQKPSMNSNWLMFRGNPELTGVTFGKISDSLKLKWRFKTGESIKSSPAVEGNRVYIGSDDGKVYALDKASGNKIWEFKTEDSIESSPCIINKTVYIGSSDNFLYAINANTGKLKWKFPTKAKIISSPNWFKTQQNKILILIGSYDNSVYCIDSTTGKLAWKYEVTNYINGAPAVSAGKIAFGGCDAKLHIISATNGSKFAEFDTGAYIPGSPALVDGYAYVGNYAGKFICANIAKKKIIWTYESEGSAFFSSPAVGKIQVIIGARDNRLHCLRRDNGKLIWAFQAQDKVDCSPIIVGDKVVVGSDDGRLYIMNLSDGKEIWSYEIGSAIVGSPAFANGMIIIGADDGTVYAFGE